MRAFYSLMLLALGVSSPAFSSSVSKTVAIDTSNVPSAHIRAPSLWINGLMTQWTQTVGAEKPQIWAFDSNGALVIPVTEIWFSDTASARIHGATVTPNGMVVASVLAWNTSGVMSTVLCFIGPSGVVKVQQLPDYFLPEHLGYSPDGVLWGFGRFTAPTHSNVKTAYRTVQRFAPDGSWLTGSVLSTTLLPPGKLGANPAGISINGDSFLLVGAARKFLFSSLARKFVEMDNNSRTLRNLTLNFPAGEIQNDGRLNRIINAAITPSGKIYVTFNGGHVYLLDPDSLKWSAIDPPLGYFGVYGADGDSVITQTRNNGFGWFLPTP
jgi:hypothetical protein